MGRKQRKLKTTVFGVVEGHREEFFMFFLVELFCPADKNIHLTLDNSKGGTAERILDKALKNSRDRVFAWLDADFQVKNLPSEDTLRKLFNTWNLKKEFLLDDFNKCELKDLQKIYNLKNKKPTLIVSQPIAIESFLLELIGVAPCRVEMSKNKGELINQGKAIKKQLDNIIGTTREQNLEYYRKNITKAILTQKRQVMPELDLLISMLTP